jgi:Fe/S biogenesis protein NfuA
MIEITDRAKEGLAKILQPRGKDVGLRLLVTGGTPGAYQSEFQFVTAGQESPDDTILDQGPFKVYVDPTSLPKIEGVKIDYVPTFKGPSFKIDYPAPHWDDPIANQLQQLIVERINPGLASHGGYVALLDVQEGTAYMSMGGGCQGCGLAGVTMTQGIEVMIKDEIPEIKKVIDQTDHADGTNPYYQPAKGGETSDGDSPLVQK